MPPEGPATGLTIRSARRPALARLRSLDVPVAKEFGIWAGRPMLPTAVFPNDTAGTTTEHVVARRSPPTGDLLQVGDPRHGGVEVRDLDQARAVNLETLRAVAHQGEKAAAAWTDWRLDRTDVSGAILFSA
jgi:hypothetical protein